MLTPEEKGFLKYWEANRTRRRKTFWQLLLGIPIGLAFAIPIVLNLTSGWDVHARLESFVAGSGGITLLIALLLIVVFTAVFSQRVKWDRYEQRYRELMIRATEENEPADKAARGVPSAQEPAPGSPSTDGRPDAPDPNP